MTVFERLCKAVIPKSLAVRNNSLGGAQVSEEQLKERWHCVLLL